MCTFYPKNLDFVMPAYNLIEHSNNYSETSGSFYKLCRDESNINIIDSESFKFKSKFLDNTTNTDIKNEKGAMLLKYLSNFWRTLEIPLIN